MMRRVRNWWRKQKIEALESEIDDLNKLIRSLHRDIQEAEDHIASSERLIAKFRGQMEIL